MALFVDAVNASDAYREAAADWEGDIAFVFGAEPDRGVPSDVWAWLDLWHGRCRAGRIVEAEEGARSLGHGVLVRAPSRRACRWSSC